MIDQSAQIRCTVGQGIYREEVWAEASVITRYNLAFINHLLCAKDNGRVLGYDNAHGHHERHLCGKVELIDFVSYDQVRTDLLENSRS